MAQSILAVDSLVIQRSLTLLEDRYRELRDQGLKRYEVWNAEINELKQQLAEQAAQLQAAQQARDEQASRVTALEAEKVAAAKDAEVLKQHLANKSMALADAEGALAAVSGRLRQLVQR